MRLLAAVALAVLLLAQPALAQLPVLPGGPATARLQLELQDPGAPLVPARPYALQLTVRYIYAGGGLTPPDQNPCADLTVAAAPSYASVNITPTRVCFPLNPSQAFGTSVPNNTAIVGINITGPSVALEPAEVRIAAHAPPTGTLGDATGEVSRNFTTAYVGKLAAQAAAVQVVRGGAPQHVAVQLANEGNGPIEVTFRNITAPPGVRVVAPSRVTLAQPGEREVAQLTVQVPWTGPVKGPVQFEVVPRHPSRPDLAGDPVRVQFDLDGRAAIPGLELPLLVAAVGALAFARARRRA
ncbi:MAG TPA: hypothetical protein VGR28_14690 [Candidatus Thermoplasmatota archaeon]|nr:hypothetical protein [Candidatus Thermoplasmatota archaeon]